MKKKFGISIASAIAMALLVVGVVVGMSLGNVDGVWEYVEDGGDGSADCDDWSTGYMNTPTAYSNTSPSVQNNVQNDENQVRYGEPANDNCPGGDDWATELAQQSGFGFDGVASIGTLTPDTAFLLGRATHYNNPITVPTNNLLEWVDIDVTIDNIYCGGDITPSSGSTATYIFRINFDETNNSYPCAYGATNGPCNDKITVETISSKLTPIDCTSISVPAGERGTYTLQILGIMHDLDNDGDCTDQTFNSGQLFTEYITAERTTNHGCLYGIITDYTPTAVDMKAFTAGWLGDAVEINWETITESGTLGFNLFRSTSRYGEQVQLNTELIFSNAVPGSIFGANYQFVDQEATPGVEYFYWLQEVELDGDTTTHGPAEFLQ